MLQTKIFGCKTNKFFADKWLASGKLDGLEGVFVVSCVVTDQAKSRWVKFVSQEAQKLQDSNQRIYLSGCGTIVNRELDPKFWDKYPELVAYKDKIIPLGEDPHEIDAPRKKSTLKTSHIHKKLAGLRKHQQTYTRKNILIQSGCDTFCTFCATIQARGRHKNRDKSEIISEIQTFEGMGGKEIVITGINLGAWGASTTLKLEESRFHELIESILEETNIARIRISSTGIEFVSDELVKLYEETRVNPHIHLSVQSGSDKVLKKMNRQYGRDELLKRLEQINKVGRKDGVDLSIGADIIVGFPEEDDEDFQDSLNLIEDFNITKLHAFPFSAHGAAHDVPASRFEQIDNNTKYTRLREIIQTGDKVREKFVQENVGKTLKLLVEKTEGEMFSGWSENYIALDESNFKIETGRVARNEIVTGTLIDAANSGIENTESII